MFFFVISRKRERKADAADRVIHAYTKNNNMKILLV
jgi:hypothetical protein